MGTNFYARIIPKEEDKQKLLDAINNNQYDVIEDFTSELYGKRDQYSRRGNVIHLGKRSAGWKFLWNPNVIKYWDGYMDLETKEYVHIVKYDYIYPLTKQGVTDFCNREDVSLQMNMESYILQKIFLKWHFLGDNQMDILVKPMKKHTKKILLIETFIGVRNTREECIQKVMRCGSI